MKKLNRKQIRTIIAKESRNFSQSTKQRLSQDSELERVYNRAYDGFYEDELAMAGSSYNPDSEFIDIDHETGIEEIPPVEDVDQMARYHALNNDRDEILYRDNPDYRSAYDDTAMTGSKRLSEQNLMKFFNSFSNDE